MRYNIHVELTRWSWEGNGKGGRNITHFQLHKHLYNEIQNSCEIHLLKLRGEWEGEKKHQSFPVTQTLVQWDTTFMWNSPPKVERGVRNGRPGRNISHIQFHKHLHNEIQHLCATHLLKLRGEWERGKKHQSFQITQTLINFCKMKAPKVLPRYLENLNRCPHATRSGRL